MLDKSFIFPKTNCRAKKLRHAASLCRGEVGSNSKSRTRSRIPGKDSAGVEVFIARRGERTLSGCLSKGVYVRASVYLFVLLHFLCISLFFFPFLPCERSGLKSRNSKIRHSKLVDEKPLHVRETPQVCFETSFHEGVRLARWLLQEPRSNMLIFHVLD